MLEQVAFRGAPPRLPPPTSDTNNVHPLYGCAVLWGVVGSSGESGDVDVYLRDGERGFALLEHPPVPLGDVLLSFHLALPLAQLGEMSRDLVVLARGVGVGTNQGALSRRWCGFLPSRFPIQSLRKVEMSSGLKCTRQRSRMRGGAWSAIET